MIMQQFQQVVPPHGARGLKCGLKQTKFLSILLALSMVLCLLPVTAFAADVNEEVYALMNIPYEKFYSVAGVTNSVDYDAISTATNKVGNYGKAGGAYHGDVPTNDNGTAVGGANGAKTEGVIWPVKITRAELADLGGTEVTDSDTKMVATLGQGKTTTTTVVSYETLMESKAYSYYILSGEPANYIDWANGISSESRQSGNGSATVSYGSHWGDVQLTLTDVDDVANFIINAVVVTTQDSNGETSTGFVHLYNVWSASQMAWKVAQISGLDGATITNIRYYCSVKDSDTTDTSAPDYENYVYDYSIGAAISPVYTGTLTASFDSASQITVSGLPADAENVKATVYHTTGGKNAVVTYLTPLVVDPADDDIDPTTTAVVDGKIAISPELVTVTNSKGESKTYGQPVDGTEYTIELSSDNWVFDSISATYTAAADESVTVDGEPVDMDLSAIKTGDGYDFSKLDLSNTDIFADGADGAYLVTIGEETQLVGDTTLKKWVGNWESWQNYIYPDEATLARYPYLEQVWELAYDAYKAAFAKVGLDISSTMPDADALKTYWDALATTKGVDSMEVTGNAKTGYTITWEDASGNVLASDTYTMTGKMLKGFEGAAAYVFTADHLNSSSAYKYFVAMEAGMEGDSTAPIAAHFHFQFGSSLDDMLLKGELYNSSDYGTDSSGKNISSNLSNSKWYATMIDADATDLAKYNVILGMHQANKWTSLPSSNDDDNTPATYTVTFNSQGGSSVSSQSVTDGKTVTKPANPTRSGYTFGGWFVDSACTTAYNFSTAVTANLTLYAKWTAVKPDTPATHTVTFNSQGGSSVSSQSVTDGETVTKPADPTRSGYTFEGWFVDSACTTAYNFSTAVTANLTLYAKWVSTGSSGSSDKSTLVTPVTTPEASKTYTVKVPAAFAGGTVTASSTNAAKGDTVTLTVSPYTGYALNTLKVISAAGQKEVEVELSGNTATFVMPSATVKVQATFHATDGTTPASGFSDVPDTSPFSNAVAWAVQDGITTGVTLTTFEPRTTCTNAQILTFLWRSQGEPETEAACPVDDVDEDSPFYTALCWAGELGLIEGGNGKDECTRSMAVTYLWKLAGSPSVEDSVSFSDVPDDTGAVAWALSEGITNGVTESYFEPDTICTRGQIVTFLYRAYA